jgi:hypothetical protein
VSRASAPASRSTHRNPTSNRWVPGAEQSKKPAAARSKKPAAARSKKPAAARSESEESEYMDYSSYSLVDSSDEYSDVVARCA